MTTAMITSALDRTETRQQVDNKLESSGIYIKVEKGNCQGHRGHREHLSDLTSHYDHFLNPNRHPDPHRDPDVIRRPSHRKGPEPLTV